MSVDTNTPQVTSQSGALVGDDKVAEAVKPDVQVFKDEVAAQVAGPREDAPATVTAHEVVVSTDRPVLDPTSPEAVQIPDAGRGSLDLPIHQLAKGTPEDQFAADSKPAAKK